MRIQETQYPEMEPHVLSEQELLLQNKVMNMADEIVDAEIAALEAQLNAETPADVLPAENTEETEESAGDAAGDAGHLNCEDNDAVIRLAVDENDGEIVCLVNENTDDGVISIDSDALAPEGAAISGDTASGESTTNAVSMADSGAAGLAGDKTGQAGAVQKTENAIDSGRTAVKKRRRRKPFARVMTAALIIALLMTGGAVAGSRIITMYPYAITANDDIICYVNDKTDGTEAVQKAVESLATDDSDIILFSTGDDFRIERTFDTTKSEIDIKTSDEAAKCISEAVAKAPEKFPEIAVAATRVEKRTFTPDPIYVMDENALAGTTIVKEESRDGSEAVTIDYVTVNGKVVKEEETNVEILDEGRSATIEKGVLGLPDGEAWETYEGDPVYNDGEDLVTTALTYVGKLRYVRGGTSLTKGVDCTGFVQQIYKLYGINLKPGIRHEGISVSYSNAQPGDVICYAHHYAIYMGNGKIVHAAGPKYGVTVSKVSAGGKITDVRRIVR